MFFLTFRKSIRSSTSNLHFIPCDISKVCVNLARQSWADVARRAAVDTGTVSHAADVDQDLTSPQRCLADSLLLLAEQQVADQKLWLLPQAQWQEGETLRQTAERALASLPGNTSL